MYTAKQHRLVSIHVPLAEHDNCRAYMYARGLVSIHVPLAEHDGYAHEDRWISRVSIHVPLAEHDALESAKAGHVWGFNSRAPRGARLTATLRSLRA